jgi:preprotein translocase subunit SecA
MRALQAQHAEAGSALALSDGGAAPEADDAAAPASRTQGGRLPQPQQPFAPPADAQGTFVRGERKVGRNEPCPCGSGKKFKHCHGTLTSVE